MLERMQIKGESKGVAPREWLKPRHMESTALRLGLTRPCAVRAATGQEFNDTFVLPRRLYTRKQWNSMSDYEKYLREHTARPEDFFVTRRQFLNRFGMGLGALGLATLLGEPLGGTAQAADLNPLSPKAAPLPSKAKRVVHIFAQGAPSQVDTWDPKPALERFAGKTLPGSNGLAMPSPFKFTPRGKAGIPVSEVFSRIGQHVDEMAIIRSMYTDIPSHEVATVMMNTGSLRLPKPSMGSWVLYGLGSENQNMPGYISLRPGGAPPGGSQNWQSAFLPGVFQGMSINPQSRS